MAQTPSLLTLLDPPDETENPIGVPGIHLLKEPLKNLIETIDASFAAQGRDTWHGNPPPCPCPHLLSSSVLGAPI